MAAGYEYRYFNEIRTLMLGHVTDADFEHKLSDYHESDIAEVLKELSPAQRHAVYGVLTVDYLSDIFAYFSDTPELLEELPPERAAEILSRMDSDDAVKDTGIGIPKEHLDRIFERFYRVDKSHSKEVGGTGLGLSIVKHAAQIHDAKIDVKSIVGEGTEITISFPQ